MSALSEYHYSGRYEAYGGKSAFEQGGPGTVLVSRPYATLNRMGTHLYIDNRGDRPLNTYITDILKDSARASIVVEPEYQISEFSFDHVTITGSGHLSFRNNTPETVKVNIGHLHGDRTGFLHTSRYQPISIAESDSPYPAGFRVYSHANISLPKGII